MAKRLHAVLLNAEDYTSGTIARILDASRSRVSGWLRNYEQYGYEGLMEGHRCGRPPELSAEHLLRLADIIESGPAAYGYLSRVWTSPMLSLVIAEEFGCQYHPGHVRKLLHEIGFSVQRPKRMLARANPAEQNKWHRYTCPNLKKSHHRRGRADFRRRGLFSPGFDAVSNLGAHWEPASDSGHWAEEERQDFRRGRGLHSPIRLSSCHRTQCCHLFGISGSIGSMLLHPGGRI